MAAGRLIVGVDGGGTRTRCLAIDEAGHCLAAAESGPLMGLYAGEDAAEDALAEALMRCIGDLPDKASSVECVGISVPICDRERLAGIVRRHAPAASVHWVESEALACLTAATEARCGLVILSGTGSFADAIDGDTVVGHAGGFGPLLGDDGSGYAIGIAALRAAVRAYQRRSGPTGLADAARCHFDVADLWGLVDRVYGSGLPREQIGAFAPAVIRLADDGDVAAENIARRAADDLADMARAALQQAGWDERAFPAVLCGGVLDGSSALRRMVRHRLAEVAPGAQPTASRFAPVVGVALRTMGPQQAGLSATTANLDATLPAPYKTGKE